MSISSSPELAAAYAHCRAIAKREAKNFYYSFRVLPHHKSDAMCAVYAFMRKADDIADDESLSLDARRAAMADLDRRAGAHSRPGTTTSDPIFLAVNDTQRRFDIPDELLEQLVAGTTLDLEPQPEGVHILEIPTPGASAPSRSTKPSTHSIATATSSPPSSASSASASSDTPTPAPSNSPIDTGIAFQLTNILRDVKEDAERGRIYLPADLLREHNVTPERILDLAGRRTATDQRTRAPPHHRTPRPNLLPQLHTNSSRCSTPTPVPPCAFSSASITACLTASPPTPPPSSPNASPCPPRAS